MKKLLLIFISVLIALSFASCKKADDIYTYLEQEGERQYIVLPQSGYEVSLYGCAEHLDKIDVELLKKAEQKILKDIEEKLQKEGGKTEHNPYFSLHIDDEGYLCLRTEVIIEYEPKPFIDEFGNEGYQDDHDHAFFTERISKAAVE